jgi:ABC-2 type transport system permease protein
MLMKPFWLIFRAELKRYYAESWSRIGDTVSWLVYAVMMFAAIVVVLMGVTDGNFGRKEQLLVLVGWLTYMVASDCMAELPGIITDETESGTLEQLCITPISLWKLLFIRSLVFFFGAGIRGVLMAVLLYFFVSPQPFNPALLLLFFISLLGAYGMGFLFAGLALVIKQVSSLTGLVFSLMIFTTGAFVELEKLGWVESVFRIIFPLTWGISLMRSVLTEQASLASLYWNGELFGIILHSIAYLVIGLGALGWGYRRARGKGTLAHY